MLLSTRKFVVAGVVALICGGIGGAAFAADSVPSAFPTNDAGESYGSALWVGNVSDEPDLIEAIATTGKSGYVRKSELDAANGSTVETPQEALEFRERVDKLIASGTTSIFIPVYAEDGRTVIGEFEIALAGGELVVPDEGSE